MKSPTLPQATPSHVTRLRLMQLYAWREDVLTEGRPAPMAETSTDAPIGSEERLAIYEARAARGQELHHPGDSRRIHSPAADTRRSRKRSADRLAARIAPRMDNAVARSR